MSVLWQPFPMPEGRRAQAWRHHPAFRRPAHFHDEPEINLVARGSATFVVGCRRVPMSAGSLSWYPPGLDHYLEDATDDLELYVVGFLPELLAAYAREHGAAPRFARPLTQVDERTLDRCAEAFGAASSNADDAAVEAQLLALLASLDRAGPAPALGHRAAALVLETPALGRDELARRLASNRGDVSRRLHRDHGMSLAEYKNRLQTLRLIALLEAGQGNLTRAALDAGFGSYSRCFQVVRGLFGCAPNVLLDPVTRRSLADRLEPFGAE
ncbi:MAG TPA: AraC family ligand binding domain-containing protein [Polyangiaceae bacterium]|nr:AraC family ligand binding domain-containing protein [Polyangiaceae bacterium]